ncbi:MAG: DUF3365 domain-containing protein [Gemmatimonadetes bacterium]|nr:DUF3365 domain-containing protein [Gemmatimonadota bacterium]
MNRFVKRVPAFLLVATGVACEAGGQKEVSPDVQAAALEVGGSASRALMGALVAQLTGAMQHGGPVNAVDFCSTSAIGLTSGVARQQGLDLKRTSMKVRNPANAPDEDETAALRYFESAIAETGELPSPWVQRAGRDEYRYYQPLTIAPPCLSCHGASGEIDPAVQAILDERYPGDLATDYAVGDFRGVIRVSIPAERLEER